MFRVKFLNRKSELERLTRLVDRGVAGLAALWGRRRVGKSRLLVELCRRCEGGLYTVADQSAAAVQRAYFARALAGRLPGFEETSYPDWERLLRRLSRDARARNWRGPLVIDEFPYWVAASPELPSLLQRWIDEEARESGLLAIVAGSSQEMMQGMVLNANAPLYGRALEAIDLPPLGPHWITAALKLRQPIDALRAYALWGGVPRYWELAEPFGADLDKAVDELVLQPQAPLHREPDRLLLEELPPAVSLRPVLDLIGSGVHRLSEIAARLGQPATSLSRPLSRLCDLGLVQREIPHGASEKSGKRTLYRIRDPFFRFWFRVVAPHRALLAAASASGRRAHFRRHAEALFAASWEQLCLQAAQRGDRLGQEPFSKTIPYTARRWWKGNAPEWDLIASPHGKGPVIVGEAKWSETPFDVPALDKLATALLARPLPPHIEGEVRRVLFVPAARTQLTSNGIPVIDGRVVLKGLD